jgi:predicted nucleotidyltransferase
MAARTTTWTTKDGRSLWNDRSLADWVPALTNDIVAAIAPIQVWLFGSVARGNDNPDSDIDLLIVVEPHRRTHALELDHTIRRTTDVPAPFDLVFTDPTSMTQRNHIAGSIERAAQTSGRLVHQRD